MPNLFFDRLAARMLLSATFLAALLLGAPAHAASAPAGSVIGNQASASYVDASQVPRNVTSNTVVTTVQQVASVTLVAPGAKTISAAGQVYYPQTIVNTGNGPDSFNLSSTQAGGMTFSSLLFYADANGDGIPDSATPITATTTLNPGDTFKFVVAGVVPSTAVAGTINTTTVTASSAFTPATAMSIVDVTTVTSNAVINVTQALDITSGPSPSNGRTVTLTYTNTGNATATGVTLNDAIPAGMTYVANSARWSVTGSGVVLTDASNSDSQSGIIYDYNVTSPGKPTAVIASVAAGVSGTLTFQVNVNAGLAPGPITMTGTYAYNDGVTTIPPSSTNTVQYTVLQTAALTFAGSTVPSAPQGGTVVFTNVLKNTGNGTDSFDITFGTSSFPVGTVFQLFQADGLTPLMDTNGNGIPDTGPLAANATFNVVVKAVLPPNSTAGNDSVSVIGTSKADVTKSATAVDTLTTITTNAVDLTNDTTVVGGSGAGLGPELNPVLTLATNPGTTLRFPLIVTNGSAIADSFDLAGATDAALSAGLPTGWTLVFHDSNGAVITNTGVVLPATSKYVFGDVTIPASYVAGTTHLYFRSLSAVTGAGDRLHDAVTVNVLRGIVVTPNHTGQLTAGGTITYVHTVSNTGNVLEGDGVASTDLVTTSDNGSGFTSIVYWDKNNNGVLDAGDVVVTSLAQLTGGTGGASTAAGLSAGETATLIVKVTAPAGANPGLGDTTTLTVTTSGVIGGVAAPVPSLATDASTVVGSQVTLVTMQALDANCDGLADTGFSITAITSGALPNGCIRYQVTATNAGALTVTGVVITDATPPLTTYSSAVAAATTIGTVTAPGNGSAGTIQATVGALTPGQSAVLTFGVRINP